MKKRRKLISVRQKRQRKKGGTIMSMMPMYKKCPLCGKTYSFNPSVGKMFCTACAENARKAVERGNRKNPVNFLKKVEKR